MRARPRRRRRWESPDPGGHHARRARRGLMPPVPTSSHISARRRITRHGSSRGSAPTTGSPPGSDRLVSAMVVLGLRRRSRLMDASTRPARPRGRRSGRRWDGRSPAHARGAGGLMPRSLRASQDRACSRRVCRGGVAATGGLGAAVRRPAPTCGLPASSCAARRVAADWVGDGRPAPTGARRRQLHRSRPSRAAVDDPVHAILDRTYGLAADDAPPDLVLASKAGLRGVGGARMVREIVDDLAGDADGLEAAGLLDPDRLRVPHPRRPVRDVRRLGRLVSWP